MENEYFDFLCKITGNKIEYQNLLEYLYEIEFYSLVPNDDNRGVDGEQIRNIFIDEVGPTGAPSLPHGPCNVLEMLIGLSYRLEFEFLGGPQERPASELFWILIDNLNLDWATNEKISVEYNFYKVGDIIKTLLDRQYCKDGRGGLFPLKNTPKKDQRQVEIWYQMNNWVIENNPI